MTESRLHRCEDVHCTQHPAGSVFQSLPATLLRCAHSSGAQGGPAERKVGQSAPQRAAFIDTVIGMGAWWVCGRLGLLLQHVTGKGGYVGVGVRGGSPGVVHVQVGT